VSKQKLRRAEGIALVRQRRDAGLQELAFAARPFVLCGLPLRRPPAGQLMFERRNGRFTLQVTGHPEFGLPFGQDRLVPIFLATLAVRQKSPIVRFGGGKDVLEMFGLANGGKEYRRIVAAFERILGATIFFTSDSGSGSAWLVQRARFNFMSAATIWYNGSAENEIVLSDQFYREVAAHPIPVELGAVRLLAASPGVLDLFRWLSYRCFTAKRPGVVPLFGHRGLSVQLGVAEYSRPRRFRAMLQEWLARVREVWPAGPAQIDGDMLAIKQQSAWLLGRHRNINESRLMVPARIVGLRSLASRFPKPDPSSLLLALECQSDRHLVIQKFEQRWVFDARIGMVIGMSSG
jgi:hypothetical protein